MEGYGISTSVAVFPHVPHPDYASEWIKCYACCISWVCIKFHHNLSLDHQTACGVCHATQYRDLLRSCVIQGKDGMVYGSWFFCLDTAGNILITDRNRDSIKILSPSGQLMHEIGKRGYGRGELVYPFGICLSQTGNIFVISDNSNFDLQSF